MEARAGGYTHTHTTAYIHFIWFFYLIRIVCITEGCFLYCYILLSLKFINHTHENFAPNDHIFNFSLDISVIPSVLVSLNINSINENQFISNNNSSWGTFMDWDRPNNYSIVINFELLHFCEKRSLLLCHKKGISCNSFLLLWFYSIEKCQIANDLSNNGTTINLK